MYKSFWDNFISIGRGEVGALWPYRTLCSYGLKHKPGCIYTCDWLMNSRSVQVGTCYCAALLWKWVMAEIKGFKWNGNRIHCGLTKYSQCTFFFFYSLTKVSVVLLHFFQVAYLSPDDRYLEYILYKLLPSDVLWTGLMSSEFSRL